MYYETAKQFLGRQGCNLRFSPTGARILEDGLVAPGFLRAARDVEDRTGQQYFDSQAHENRNQHFYDEIHHQSFELIISVSTVIFLP